MTELGRDLLVPDPVVVEVDQLLRSRHGSHPARLFLGAIAAGEHTLVNLAPRSFRRATEFDAAFADLDLGHVDGAVIAIAERDNLPILTFDFEHFRVARPARGFWRLVIDEHRYQRHVRA